jgi:hypothetical protein
MEMWQLPVEHYLLRICEGEVSEKMKNPSGFFPNRDNSAPTASSGENVRNFGTYWYCAVHGFLETDEIQARKSFITKLA